MLGIENIKATTETPASQKKTITFDKIGVIVDWAIKNQLTIDKIAEQYDFATPEVRQAIVDALDDNDLPE